MQEMSPQRFHDFEKTTLLEMSTKSGWSERGMGRGKNPEFFRTPEIERKSKIRLELEILDSASKSKIGFRARNDHKKCPTPKNGNHEFSTAAI